MKSQIRIAPSILAANFACLGEAVSQAEAAGADVIHVDVMDGHFVPNITIGPLVVAALRQVTSLTLDVHLMIEKPARYIGAFAKAGADNLTVHPEATVHLHRVLQQLQTLNVRAGVALNPGTPETVLAHVLPLVDLVLVMTVNPGFGGQTFIPEMLTKIRAVRQMLEATSRDVWLAVDGGINRQTAALIAEAGADTLIAGTAIFGAAEGITAAVANLRAAF